MGNKKGEREGQPDARAIEAIHHQAKEAVAQPGAQLEHKVEWTVLGHQQMGQSPDRQDTEQNFEFNREFTHHDCHEPYRTGGGQKTAAGSGLGLDVIRLHRH